MLLLSYLLNYMILLIMVLVSVSFFTLFERKLLSYIQLRKGPNKVGIMGILQAFSDGIKLFTNELFLMKSVNMFMYNLAPFLMFFISYIVWLFYPFIFNEMVLFNWILLIICFFSLNVYPVMFAGMYSKSIYSTLGGIRSVAQTISYEVSFIFLIFCFIIIIESFNLMKFFELDYMLFLFNFPVSFLLYMSVLAELNRTPFDFSEAESELVSGFNIEYMSGGFSLIFLGEYSNIIFLNLFFLMMNFNLKINLIFYLVMFILWMLLLFLVIMIRALLPRYRYDKLMFLAWLMFLPFSMNYLIYLLMMKFMMIY